MSNVQETQEDPGLIIVYGDDLPYIMHWDRQEPLSNRGANRSRLRTSSAGVRIQCGTVGPN